MLEHWETGQGVNLELAMTVQDRFGGHLVSGHVDCLGVLKKKESIKGSIRLDFEVPRELIKYISKKGSVAINGVSLTVNSVNKNLFSVNIISHTLKNTTLSFLVPNDKVNIEVDTIARYAVNAAECYIKEK